MAVAISSHLRNPSFFHILYLYSICLQVNLLNRYAAVVEVVADAEFADAADAADIMVVYIDAVADVAYTLAV